tara:strand:+ start:3070 stop:3414 length:345 start_codon:yes stop_codon:yes gene_type:complete
MSLIPMIPKGVRTKFFDDGAMDKVVTMMLEMMTELWVVKERVYALEKVLDKGGMSTISELEDYRFSKVETAELEAARRVFVKTIMRALETDFVDRASVQSGVDNTTDAMSRDDG